MLGYKSALQNYRSRQKVRSWLSIWRIGFAKLTEILTNLMHRKYALG